MSSGQDISERSRVDPHPGPFWSVMIPTYRAGRYLKECLESVLVQDPGPDQMQIEVVDDASPAGDGPDVSEAVRAIAGDRVSVFRQPKNLGLAGNWNSCIDRARGQWVHVLHQDDKVLPGFYDSFRRGVEGRDEQIQAGICRFAHVTSDGTVTLVAPLERPTAGPLDHGEWVRRMAVNVRFQCVAIVARKALYDQIGKFRTDLVYALDWEMWLRMAVNTDFWYEPQLLAWWREHEGSATSRLERTGENIRDLGRSIDLTRHYLPPAEADELVSAARGYYAQWALRNAGNLIARGETSAANNQIREALKLCPSWPVRKKAWRLRLSQLKRWATGPPATP